LRKANKSVRTYSERKSKSSNTEYPEYGRKVSSGKRVFVGLSGGVDSSVAAFLLKIRGYDVTGVHIRGYNVDGCADDDALMARRAAEKIGIPFYVWNMEREYKRSVVDYMVSSYKSGITPNPDVMCNKEIKFGLFFEKARLLGADYIATGHYALLDPDKPILCLAKDGSKDQTYFLWTLDRDILKRTLFPLGDLLKSEVRKIAAKAGLPNAGRKDSQGICFLGKLKMADFLSRYIKDDPGPIMDPEGKVLGTHRGLGFYTLGQRHLGIKGMGGGESLYVARKEKSRNSLILAPGKHPLLFTEKTSLTDINLVSGRYEGISDILVRVRYRAPLSEAKLSVTGKGKGTLLFKKPVLFVAPGQSAVFYSPKGEMLGGGIIA